MEHYVWENNPSKKAYVTLAKWPQNISDDDVKSYSIDNDTVGQKYKDAVTELFDNGITNLFKTKTWLHLLTFDKNKKYFFRGRYLHFE